MPLTEEQYKAAGFSDEEIQQRKNKYKIAGFTDQEITQAFGGITKPSPREQMANIPALTPQQELAAPTLTSEEQERARKEALTDIPRFFWSGPKEAKEQFMRGVTPALEMAGATAGSFFGPWGTALGFATGGRVGKGIETMTGVSKPETLPEATIATARDVGIGLLPWGLGKIARIPGAVKEAVTRPWTKAGKIKEVFESVGGKLEPSVAGELGTAGAKRQYSTLSKQGNQLYESAKKLAPEGSKAELSNLYSAVDEALKDEMASPAEKKFASDWLRKITPAVRTGQRRVGLSPELQQEILEKAEGELGITLRPSTVQEAYALRSELSETMTKGGKVGWRAGRFLDALHNDLTEATEKLGIPEAKDAFKKAIDFWRSKVIPQRETVNLLEKKSVERIPGLLQKDIATIQQLKATLPEEGFKDLKRGMLTDVANKVENNPTKTSQQLRKLLSSKKELMENIFDPEELEAIRISADPGKFGRYLENHPRIRWLVKWLPVGLAIEMGREVLGGKLPFTVHHGMESRQMGGPVLPAFSQRIVEPSPTTEGAVGRVLPHGIISTRGILNKPEPQQAEVPPKGGGANYEKELSQSRQAIASGAPADQVKAMFKSRTGREYPE